MSLRTHKSVRDIRRVISRYPTLFFPVSQLTGNTRLVDDDTDLVVEGYPRSANSFTEAAFLHSQRELDITLATHSHAAAQVIRAVDKSIPAVVLIRHPDQAIASMMAISADGDAAQHFRDYVAFYRPLAHLRAAFVTVEFSQALSRFDDVVRAVNSKYGANLAVPVLDEHFDKGVERERDRVSQKRVGQVPTYSAGAGETYLQERRDRQNRTIKRLQDGLDASAADLRDQAVTLYNTFVQSTDIR